MTTSRSITFSLIAHEVTFGTSRSSGPGGQNVNKVNSKVTLKFPIGSSNVLSEDEKQVVLRKLATRLTKEGVLILSSQDKRSQLLNKEAVVLKLEQLLSKALEKKKIRKKTRPTKGSVHDRMAGKKRHSEKKKWRRSPI